MKPKPKTPDLDTYPYSPKNKLLIMCFSDATSVLKRSI